VKVQQQHGIQFGLNYPVWHWGFLPYSLRKAISAAMEQCKFIHSYYQPQSLSNPMSNKVYQDILSFANNLKNNNTKPP